MIGYSLRRAASDQPAASNDGTTSSLMVCASDRPVPVTLYLLANVAITQRT